MKKYTVGKIAVLPAAMLAVGLLWGCSGMPSKPSAYPLDQRPVAAVMDFEYRASTTDFRDSALGLAESVAAALAETGRLKLVERGRLKTVMGEAALGLTGAVDAATAAKTGQMVGASYMILGSITRVSVRDEWRSVKIAEKTDRIVEVEAEARLIEVATGLIVASSRAVNKVTGSEKHAFGGKIGVIPSGDSLVQQAMIGMGQKLAYELAAVIPPVKKQ